VVAAKLNRRARCLIHVWSTIRSSVVSLTTMGKCSTNNHIFSSGKDSFIGCWNSGWGFISSSIFIIVFVSVIL
jgi:hypothetical protein